MTPNSFATPSRRFAARVVAARVPADLGVGKRVAIRLAPTPGEHRRGA